MRHLKSCAGSSDVGSIRMLADGLPWALLLSLMQRALARRPRTLAYFNLRVVNMRQHLGLIAHVEQRSADGVFVEMIALGSISQPPGSKRIDLELHRLAERERHGLML
jgi:hypothetical protein